MTKFETLLKKHPLMLTECAISERLRRHPEIELHPVLFNTPLIYSPIGRKRLEEIYGSYLEVAQRGNLPILICAPTWRVNMDTVSESDVPGSINQDAVEFMRDLQAHHEGAARSISVGALIAPKNDCYTPDTALSRDAAADFHGWQIEALAEAEPEVIVAQTMPAVSEALGMADKLAETGTPYIISFVINRFGRVLDGTPIAEAIDRIDQSVSSPPSGYMVNCVYPTFLDAANQPDGFFRRLIGIQANASSKDHAQLDGSELLQQDPLPDWGRSMLHLHREFGVKILGGCCGTDHTYLQYLIDSR